MICDAMVSLLKMKAILNADVRQVYCAGVTWDFVRIAMCPLH